MGTPKMFISTTHFDLFNKRSVNEFLFTKMFLFVTSFWFSATGYVFYLIGLISIYIFRFKTNNTSESHDKSCTTVGVTDREAILPQEDGPIVASSCLEPERESEITIFEDSDHDDGFPQEEEPKFCFKFQFHTSEDTPTGYRESEDSINPSKAPTVNTSKYQFSSGKDFCGFVEEPEVVSFAVKDLYADSNYDSFSDNEIIQGGFLSEKIQQLYSKAQVVYEESVGNYSPVDLSKEESGKTKSEPLTEAQVAEKEEQVSPETDLPGKEDISYEVQFLFEKDFVALDSEPESISLSDVFSLKDHAFDSNSDEFLSERDFGEGLDTGTQIYFDGEKVKLAEETQGYEEPHLQNSSFLDRAIEISDGSFSVWKPIKQISNSIDNEIELREKIRNSEEPSFQKSSNLVHAEVLSDEDFSDDEDIPDPEVIYGSQEKETMDGLERSEQPNLQDSSVPELDDTNRLEILWEHQDLIEQLRMELRKVRATGLPTILEEDESPKMMEDLKPWKIDEKYLHEDRMDELHRFYKSYRERMRKFDILNYQKMYGIGKLQNSILTELCFFTNFFLFFYFLALFIVDGIVPNHLLSDQSTFQKEERTLF
uniref:Uncharacterized protein n=1 Tax=Nelumbo nucifera TaxID=4432 RepID=A0A822YQS7_NELNU|nr:TPA_asm: hypothetical protein HUJ06_005507 [Nelumbo nucifera]